jgi:hypothetical protein
VASTAHAGAQRGEFDRPPYYEGKLRSDLRPAAHVELRFRDDAGSLDPAPERSPVLAALLDSLRAELPRLGLTVALSADLGSQRPPDVAFGCRRGGLGPDGVSRSADEIDSNEPRRMAFEVQDPNKKWKEAARAALGDSLRSIVCIQLGFGQYWVRQRDWKDNKVIDLGNGRTYPITWVTALDAPVQVLQLTASVVSPDGKVVRLGAEGLLARRTGMAASMAGGQEVLTEEDLRTLTAPSEDGNGPVWRSALAGLIARLLDPQ